jgi:hypothetical protein
MPPVWIQTRYQSAYALLGAMAEQFADACRAAGRDARPIDLATDTPPDEGTLVFFNAPAHLDALPPALFRPGSNLRAVQIFVDHPFALPEPVLDAWRERDGLRNLRLCLPCADDAHLLRLRFPGLRHAWVPHAIPPSALCPREALTPDAWRNREFDIIAAGSIATEQHIAEQLARLPAPAQAIAKDTAAIMLRDPRLGFVQALDLAGSTAGLATGEWSAAKALWRVTIMIVNRARRTAVVKALQGTRLAVFGPPAWREFCTGTVHYAGDAPYDRIHAAHARARLAIAWGPTQFAHSYSERLMLAMAAGCASISDDRLLVRRDFPNNCALYNAADPATTRAAADHLLANPDAALNLAQSARDHAERTCLWQHRVDAILAESTMVTKNEPAAFQQGNRD